MMTMTPRQMVCEWAFESSSVLIGRYRQPEKNVWLHALSRGGLRALEKETAGLI